MDDEHTMFVHLHWRAASPSVPLVRRDGTVPLHVTRTHDYLPNSTDWHGRWRLRANPDNDWLMDRAAQRERRSYTGIANIHLQDQAVTESMGPITDHLFEHLAPSDRMIMATRRRLLEAARALAEHGTVPPGVDEPGVMYPVRSGDFVTEARLDWRDAYDREMRAAVRPMRMAAE
jgi:hypothetical protein